MKISLLLLFAFICAKPCYTQWKNPGDRIPTNRPAQVLAFGGNDTSFFASYGSWQGSAPGVYRYTPDSARVWTEFDAKGGVRNVTSFCAVGRYILAGNADGTVYRTTNAGLNWTGRYVGKGDPLVSIGRNVVAGGTFKSQDSGDTWVQISKLLCDGLIAIGACVVGTSNGFIYRSTDTGANWQQIVNASGAPWCFVAFGTSLLGAGGPARGGYENGMHGIIRSLDSGATWKLVGLMNRAVAALATDGKNLFAGTDSGIYVSIDSGLTWRAENAGLKDVWTGGPSRMWTGAMAIFDTMIFVNINNYIDGGGLWSTFMRPISEMVPKSGVKRVAALPSLDTLEVFPNPASGLVTIRGSYSIERVSVLNVLGAEMLNLPNIRENELTLDLSHFASGTYFLRIETGHGTVMRKVVRE